MADWIGRIEIEPSTLYSRCLCVLFHSARQEKNRKKGHVTGSLYFARRRRRRGVRRRRCRLTKPIDSESFFISFDSLVLFFFFLSSFPVKCRLVVVYLSMLFGAAIDDDESSQSK